MEISILKEKLHQLIETSPGEKLMEIYSFFEEEWTDEFKFQLEEDYADYQVTKEVISAGDLNEAIEKLLHGK